MLKNILVTGGTGLVGSAIKNICKNYSHKYNFFFISSKDVDLTNIEKTKAMFFGYAPDYVIHLAACVGGLYKNINENADMFEKNMLINYNVIKCAHEFKVEKLIACLSTCIFPDKTTYPINESMLHNGAPHDSNYGYAYAKRMLEVQCRLYREQYKDNFICIIPTNIYGPYDNYHLENAHVLPALIHKCYLAKKNNQPFIIRGTGKPLRQFIYSEDLAKLILWLIETQPNNKIDNIILSVSENEEVSIENIAKMIAKEYDYEHMISFDTNYSDGQYKKTVTNEKLMRLLDLYPCNDFTFTHIEDGVTKSVKWFNDNANTFCRK